MEEICMSEESNLIPKMNNYREILEYVQKNYADNIAYKYKENIIKDPPKYIEKKI